MVLSEKWQVSDEDLIGHVDAVKQGQSPRPLFEETSTALPKVSARFKSACPQLGQTLTSPRQPSSVLQSTAFSSLARGLSSDGNKPGASPRHPRIGNAIRLDLLSKSDTIPSVQSGRRFNGAPTGLIRVYIKMPSISGNISFWVDPDLPVHPPDLVALRDSQSSSAKAASLKTAYVEAIHSGDDASPTGCAPIALRPALSLQEVIEQCTGVPASRQKLRAGAVRIDRNGDSHVRAGCTLRQCSVNHGSVIFMSDTRLAVHHHMMRQALSNHTGAAWVMPRWHHSHKPKLIGEGPDGLNMRCENPYYHDYSQLPEIGAYDPVNTIRGRFSQKQ